MAMSRSELKSLAKQQIKGNVWTFFGLTLVFQIILAVSSFFIIGPLILTGSLQLGLTLFMIEVVRTKKGQFNTGFNGFNQFGAAFVSTLLMCIFISLWSLLFVFPGIIACFRYALTYYIIADNPEMSASTAIKKSKEMMKGHKWELFVLLFSFFWWYLLCFITFGLALIYVTPYVEATVINFYEKLKEEKSASGTDNSVEE